MYRFLNIHCPKFEWSSVHLLSCLLLGCSVFTACNPGRIRQSADEIKETVVIGHRGFAGKYPENSEVAIRQALDLGVDRIEIDIRQSKDGVVLLMHDEKIDRTTNGKGSVGASTYEELRKFHLHQDDGQPTDLMAIPTLEDILRLVDARSQLLIEIKDGNDTYDRIIERTIELVQKYDAEEWCIIQSFKDDILEDVHRLAPNFRLHKLLLSPLFYDLDHLSFVSEFSVYHSFVNQGLIKRIHQRGKKINIWTVNKGVKMEKYLKAGIDGIITDRPDILLQILKRK
ncbi:MAG: glycerophosphodiester phosphodiesterase family protein [Bacteroidota bacterium]